MKFNNGMWMVREGFTVSAPAESYDSKTDGNSVTVYGPYAPIRHRGSTLNLGQMTLTVSSPMENIVKVKIENFAGALEKGPAFSLAEGNPSVSIEKGEGCCVLTSGKLSVKIGTKGVWGLDFSYDGKLLTGTSGRSMAYCVDDEGNPYIRDQLRLDVGENIYGLGERFTAFVKNGQSVDIWNEDGGTDSEQAYKNIPFFLSSKGYGVFVNDPGKVSFEVASELITKTQFSVPGESMEYYFIGGDSLKDVVGNYTALTGRPPMVPAWTFGLWLTTSFTTDYDEKTVMSFIDGMLERDIPLTTFHFDCFWMKEFQWCDFLWNDETFPDPQGMLNRIKERGIKICVWINPYIAQKSRLFKEGAENGYFVKTGDGSVWQWDMWQGGMALVDFTNPDAVEWYKGYLRELIDMGVDSFKTDFGERIPVQAPIFGPRAAKYGIRYADGSDPDKMHNYYTLLYNKAVYEVLEEKLGEGEACLFARSATVGGQKYPVHWGGDNLANYASMAQSLRGGLSLGLCGFGYWSHDIGGFESGCNPDIFKRWTQFGLLSSHSRYHGSGEYKVPWLYGDEAVDVTRAFTKLKHRLMPYLYHTAYEAHATGVPMMRPMVLEFPKDRTALSADQQYMLGSSLLAAPIFNDRGEGEYYLPEGRWQNLLTGDVREGGRWYRENFDYMTLPLMVRENSLIPLGNTDARPDYDFSEDAVLVLCQLGEGKTAAGPVCGPTGETAFTVTVRREGNLLQVSTEGAVRPFKLLLRGVSAESVSGAFESEWGAVVALNGDAELKLSGLSENTKFQ